MASNAAVDSKFTLKPPKQVAGRDTGASRLRALQADSVVRYLVDLAFGMMVAHLNVSGSLGREAAHTHAIIHRIRRR